MPKSKFACSFPWKPLQRKHWSCRIWVRMKHSLLKKPSHWVCLRLSRKIWGVLLLSNSQPSPSPPHNQQATSIPQLWDPVIRAGHAFSTAAKRAYYKVLPLWEVCPQRGAGYQGVCMWIYHSRRFPEALSFHLGGVRPSPGIPVLRPPMKHPIIFPWYKLLRLSQPNIHSYTLSICAPQEVYLQNRGAVAPPIPKS